MDERWRVVVGSLAGAVVLGVLAAVALWGEEDSGSGGGRVGSSAPAPLVTDSLDARPSGSGTPVFEGPTPPPVDMSLARGSAKAPVTIVEFGDFKCPNCTKFAQSIGPVLWRKYVDSGVVRVFWRDHPIRGRESRDAAVAARAASRQGKFWAFHDALFAANAPLDDARLRAAARRVGLDLRKFEADRRDAKVREAVDRDAEFAARLGMPGTPAFLINGKLFFGAQPVEAFEQAIEKARRGQ